jgi:hypothetical protein
VISALAGGDAARAAQLALAVVTAAERLLSTDPQMALAAAAAVVDIVNVPAVQDAVPAQAIQVDQIAARIVVSPEARQVDPTLAAQIATTVNADIAAASSFEQNLQQHNQGALNGPSVTDLNESPFNLASPS